MQQTHQLTVAKGTTSKKIRIFIGDSSVTTGAGKTGLVYNTASLAAYYMRDGDASPTAITLATASVGTWTTGGFVEVSSGNMPGVYELGIPNAVLASGANNAEIMLKGAANMSPVIIAIDLVSYDPNDSVRAGLTSLPNVAFGATGGLASLVIRASTAQAGAAGTITLDASASAVDNFYQRCKILTTGGTGAGQCRSVASYVGSTKVATITPNWATNPDNTTTFAVLPDGLVDLTSAGVDLVVEESGINLRQAIALIGAATCGKVSGAATSTITIKNMDGTTTRIVATVDSDGNRSAVTLSAPT